jgi:hypothetical protein
MDLYPKDKEELLASEPPRDVIKLIDQYLSLLIMYLAENRGRTHLELRTPNADGGSLT